MPARLRPQYAPTDDRQQLQLLAAFPEQHLYELIRPVVLFGQSPAERAQQTGAPQRTLYRQAARFDREGIASLFGPTKVERHHRLPEEIRRHILALRAEHPPLGVHEITTICWVQFGRRPSPHTVKRILAETPPVPVTARRYPPCHRIPDPADRRHAIYSLHSEGWNKQSIADYLHAAHRAPNRETVRVTLVRWLAEGVPGLDDKSRAPHHPARKTGYPLGGMRAMLTVKEMQENPELGAWRVHAALRQVGIHLSPPGALWADVGASSR